MKKILCLGLLLAVAAIPQVSSAASNPFTFTAKIAQPVEGSTIKTGSTVNLFVKIAPPATGSGFKTNFIVTWPDGSSQRVSPTSGLDLDLTKVINGPMGTKAISVFAVMTQTDNTYVASSLVKANVNIVGGPLAITSSVPTANKNLKTGAAQAFSVQITGGQAPYDVKWVFPDGKSVSVKANSQGLASTSWVPNGQGGQKLVLVAVTDKDQRTVLKNQYVIVDTSTSPAKFHDADLNKNYVIDAGEMSYATRLYQAKTGSYGCSSVKGEFSADANDRNCTPFNGDVNKDWKLSLTELNRITQLYNSGGYAAKAGTEDGFIPVSKPRADSSTQNQPGLFAKVFNSLSPQNLLGAVLGWR